MKIRSLVRFALRNPLLRRAHLRLHAGEAFECPFCGYRSKDWASIGLDFPVLREKQVVGAGLREGGCHSCGSSDRERLVWVVIKDELRMLERLGSSILHVAPEQVLSERLLAAGFERYVCGDLYTEGYKYPAHVQNLDVLDMPFEEGSFDLVICNHVLEHIPDDRAAMRSLLRVLKPGGVPISLNTQATSEDPSVVDPKARERLFGQFNHVRIYGQDYESRLREAGFRVERKRLAERYPRQGLHPDEEAFLCWR